MSIATTRMKVDFGIVDSPPLRGGQLGSDKNFILFPYTSDKQDGFDGWMI